VSRKVINETQLQAIKRTRRTRKKAAHAQDKRKLSSAPAQICLQLIPPMRSENAILQRSILDPELRQGQYSFPPRRRCPRRLSSLTNNMWVPRSPTHIRPPLMPAGPRPPPKPAPKAPPLGAKAHCNRRTRPPSYHCHCAVVLKPCPPENDSQVDFCPPKSCPKIYSVVAQGPRKLTAADRMRRRRVPKCPNNTDNARVGMGGLLQRLSDKSPGRLI